MWKVGGLKIETAAGRRIILPGWNRNWWKSAFFYKTLRTRKFSRGKFFEGSTHGILMHSRFRICVLKGSATHFWPCYSCPKSGEGGKTRFASKNKEALKVITRLPEIFLSQILVREVSKCNLETFLSWTWGALSRLRAGITRTKMCRRPLWYTYSEPWVRKDSVGTPFEKFSPWKFSGAERFIKKCRFSPISVSPW